MKKRFSKELMMWKVRVVKNKNEMRSEKYGIVDRWRGGRE